MRRNIMSDRQAWQIVRPRTRSDRRGLWKLTGYILLIVFFIATVLHLRHSDQDIRAQTWQSAVATIVDARPLLWMQANSNGGGDMLYQVEVLSQFEVAGKRREQWITISGPPLLRADAQLKAHILIGKICIIRWKPSDTAHAIAEIS